MDLQIRNFGAIENADVKFDGLTVIAGENDTGKSTVGKLVFAVIKAISRYEQDLEVGKDKNVARLVENLYLKIRRTIRLDDSYRKEFSPRSFINELSSFIRNQPSLFQEFESEQLNSLFQHKQTLIENIKFTENSLYSKDYLLSLLEDIKLELEKKETKSDVLKQALKRALVAEFYGNFSTKNAQAKSIINFTEEKDSLFEIQAEKNNIKEFVTHEEIPPYEDVTFVETPIIVQMYDAINSSKSIFEINGDKRQTFPVRPNVSLHIKDLMDKISNSSELMEVDLLNEKQKEIIDNIEKIIQGNWLFDRKKRDFIFTKKEKNTTSKFRSINTASGIKSFGIIQLLLLAEILNSRSLLIIDEPETHLHPKWQVQYAEIICLLVKYEIPILLTSHSPYLIQALRHYSEEYGIERFTNYYLAERNDNGLVDIDHVNDDLNRVFAKLSQPLQELVWQ